MSNKKDIASLDEMFVLMMAHLIEDQQLVWHGGSSPMAMCAILFAKRTFAPNLVYISGNSGGLNPAPPFLPYTSIDWTLTRGSSYVVGIDYIFDIACRGDMDRIFMSGAQIDKYGNSNVTAIGGMQQMKIKLPGGGGGCNLSADVKNIALWTTRHRAAHSGSKKTYTLVDSVDFVTDFGHRTPYGTRRELGLLGNGPDILITNLGVFDFNTPDNSARLTHLFPDTTIEEVQENTGFELKTATEIKTVPLPTRDDIKLLREIDPLEARKREFPKAELQRVFGVQV